MQIAIALFDQFTALDAIGPYTVLVNTPGFDVVFVAAHAGPVADDRRTSVTASNAFDEIDRPDVIVVPGGIVTRRMARDGHPVIDWIRAVHPTTSWTTSVCTGSILLGAAGVLHGLVATTHWMALDQLRAFGATPTSERVVVGDRVVTAAGVSAGIDMALTLVGMTQGDQAAQAVQLGIEYDPQPPFRCGSTSTAPPALVDSVRAAMTAVEAATLV